MLTRLRAVSSGPIATVSIPTEFSTGGPAQSFSFLVPKYVIMPSEAKRQHPQPRSLRDTRCCKNCCLRHLWLFCLQFVVLSSKTVLALLFFVLIHSRRFCTLMTALSTHLLSCLLLVKDTHSTKCVQLCSSPRRFSQLPL